MKLKRALVGLLLVAILGTATLLVVQPKEAQAGFRSEDTEDLVAYLEGDAALNLKLMALDALRRKTESGIEADIDGVARGDDLRLALFATTALGKKGTSTAKTKLKGIVEDGELTKKLRKMAMTAIAVHFKNSDDLTYLESKSKSDSELKDHYKWLKKHVYGK